MDMKYMNGKKKMKNSTKRFILLIWALIPALMCSMFGLMSILDLILRPEFNGLLMCGSFISCVVIYILFLLDTFHLYKDNK